MTILLNNFCIFPAHKVLSMNYKIIISILFFLISTLYSFSQEPTNDSLIKELKQLPEDTSKVRKTNEFIWQNIYGGLQKDIIDLGEENILIAKKLKDFEGAGTAAKNTGAVFYYGGDYETAENFYKQSLELYTQGKYPKGIADANRNIGNIYSQRGNWKQALDHFYKSLAKYEEINNTKGIAGTYDAIGITYKTSGSDNTKKALEYFKKAINVKKQFNDEKALISSYLYIGDVFYSEAQDSLTTTNSDSALYYFRKAEELSKKHHAPQFHGMINDAVGSIFLLKEQYDSAYFYLQKSLKIKVKAGNAFGIASTKKYLGIYFYQTNNNDSSIIYLTDALKTADAINADQIVHDMSLTLADIYASKEQYEKSSKLYKRYISLHDSLQNKESTKKMTQLEMQYNFDKKEKLKEAEIKRQKTISIFFIAGFFLMILMALVIFRSYRNKKKANMLLEEKNNVITQKNAMLNQQNEEIEAQRDEIEKQRDYVITQRDKIAKQNKDITDSIVYAQRIQQAVLPPDKFIDDLFSEYFILFKPRDIVSGDYYWTNKKEGKTIITAADCTGHGVPGAFMSLLGMSFLNEIVNQLPHDEIKSDIILNKLREKIIQSLRQADNDSGNSKDGMDMVLCIIDSNNNTLEYSGAYNPLILVRNNEIIKHKVDRMPVGVHHKDKVPFTSRTINIQKGDKFYMFSDGYIDQFGGERGRKFMIKRFTELILSNHKKPMKMQYQIFDSTLKNWTGFIRESTSEPYEQLDDILVIAFEY